LFFFSKLTFKLGYAHATITISCLLGGLLGDEDGVDVGEDAAGGDSDSELEGTVQTRREENFKYKA